MEWFCHFFSVTWCDFISQLWSAKVIYLEWKKRTFRSSKDHMRQQGLLFCGLVITQKALIFAHHLLFFP